MTIPSHNETSNERTIREALAAALAPGETLLEYTWARYSAGAFSRREYWIGLTAQRLVFLKPKKPGRAFSIGYDTIASLTCGSVLNNSLPALELSLGSGPGEPPAKARLILSTDQAWGAHSAALADAFKRERAASLAEHPAPPATIQQFVQQIRDLQGLEMSNAAQALAQARLERDHFLQADADVRLLRRQLRISQLPVRLAAVTYGIALFFQLWLSTRGLAIFAVGLGIVLSIVGIISLVRGGPGARGAALALALITAAYYVIINWGGLTLLDVIIWVAFGLAMCLLLIGQPGRLRTLLGAAVFGIGTVGLFLFFWLGVNYFPGAVSWLAPGLSGAFRDDFSADRGGWITGSNDRVVTKLESGGYSIQVKQANYGYSAFAPVAYFPARGEVDSRVLGDYTQAVPGLFGMACRIQQNGSRNYSVYINVYNGSYAAWRIDGASVTTPLTDPAWQPATGLKDPRQVNRIGLSCQNNQLSLTINGVQQPPVSDPAMAQFGDGRMGLFVRTLADVPAGGFKVLFDNASFWP